MKLIFNGEGKNPLAFLSPLLCYYQNLWKELIFKIQNQPPKFIIISFLVEVMFKALAKMAQNVDKKVEQQAEHIREQEEHKALQAYLLGHGHDRVHSQILLGTFTLIQPPAKS